MRRWGHFVLLLIVIILIYTYYVKLNEFSSIMGCVKKTGAALVKIDIEGSGKFASNDSLKKIVSDMYAVSSLKGNYRISENEGMVCLSNNYISIKSRKITEENLNYVSFILSQYVDNGNINNIRRTISKAFSIYHIQPSFSFLVQGKYNSKLTVAEMKKRASDIFLSTGAEYVNGIDDGNIVSLSGFVPGIAEKIKVIGKYVNLNIALRYSKQNSCTYIWIGSPIIATEY